MSDPSQSHAWAGSVELLVSEPKHALMTRLTEFLPDAGPAQIKAWGTELDVLQREGTQVIQIHEPTRRHEAVLEYMLPREAGRRPDVVLLQGGQVLVLEFKESGLLRRADLDQVSAYARDLASYHSGCEGLHVVPVLVLCGRGAPKKTVDGVLVVPADQLAHTLVELAGSATGTGPDVHAFLNGEYAPLPTLVAAARLLFDNLPLPFVKRAHSAGVHDAVQLILEQVRSVRSKGGHQLVLLTGVPGSGKTLVGLQVAHSTALEDGYRFGRRKARGAPATFLSGNGPLVQVLQNALKSTAFVQDMHRFIREYGLEHLDRIPFEQVIIFDEAQRAWDKPKVTDFYSKKLPGLGADLMGSEPQILTSIAERMEGGALVLALVGQGQEIHTGEEGGMGQWADAIAESTVSWSVLGPPALAPLFQKQEVSFTRLQSLDLDTGLRYQSAADLHHWVELVLDLHQLDEAHQLADQLRMQAFPIYVTRNLEAAKHYVHSRFGDEPLRRFGLLASSKAKNLIPHGIDPGFQATKRIRVGDWFNAEPTEPRSCCQLSDVITEFQCQGLEVDAAILCWGDDFWWDPSENNWVSKPARRSKLLRNPHQLRTNAYRVLLTRGREGVIIFVPPQPSKQMDATYEALLAAGAQAAGSISSEHTA